MNAGKAIPIVLAALLVASPAPGDARSDQTVASAVASWKQMCRSDVDSDDFAAARVRLHVLIDRLPGSARLGAMAAMMDARADPAINEAAVALFGRDGLRIDDVRRMLRDPKRPAAQRRLLVTGYRLARGASARGILSEGRCRAMATALAERLDALTGKDVPFREQRLLTRLAESMLSRYADRAEEVAPARWLLGAMIHYAESAPAGDCLAAAVVGWQRAKAAGSPTAEDFPASLAALGHWEPLVRLQAGRVLARAVEADRAALLKVWAMLADRRDEARAAALGVFAFSTTAGGKAVATQTIAFLLRDRNVGVQRAAADVLIARTDDAAAGVETLLDALDGGRQRPGPNRTGQILRVLARLADRAGDAGKRRILDAAVANLSRSPRGALEAILRGQ